MKKKKLLVTVEETLFQKKGNKLVPQKSNFRKLKKFIRDGYGIQFVSRSENEEDLRLLETKLKENFGIDKQIYSIGYFDAIIDFRSDNIDKFDKGDAIKSINENNSSNESLQEELKAKQEQLKKVQDRVHLLERQLEKERKKNKPQTRSQSLKNLSEISTNQQN